MRIIVLGASGFIGAYLVDALLAKGHEVIPAGRSETAAAHFRACGVDMVQLDVSQEQTFQKLPTAGIDAVVNLSAIIPAADRSLNAANFITVNALGAYNSLSFCVKNAIPIHILTTSHFAVEGFWGCWDNERIRIDETMGVNFLYKGDHAAYIVTKVAAEEYARHFAEEYGLRSIVFRLSGVRGFGRYESGFEFFVGRARAGRDIEVFGDPDKVWDNIYVKDVVRAIGLALEHPGATGLYLLSSGIPLSLLEEVSAIADVFSPAGRRVRVIPRPDKPGGIQKSYVYDITRVRESISFEPSFPLNARHTLEDYAHEVERALYRWLRVGRSGVQ